jgi:hypothetical protein
MNRGERRLAALRVARLNAAVPWAKRNHKTPMRDKS